VQVVYATNAAGGPISGREANQYGHIHAELTRLGRPIGDIDMRIADIANSLGNCTVVSTGNDLTAVPGLSVENWLA